MTLEQHAHSSTELDRLLFAVVIGGIFAASLSSLQAVYIVGFAMICVLTAINSPFYFLLLYVVFLPTNDIFNKEQFLFGAVGIKQVLGATMIALYMMRYREIEYAYKCSPALRQYGFLIRTLTGLVYILLVYWIYSYFKNAWFGMHGFDWNLAFMRTINIFLFLFGLVPFIKIACAYISPYRFRRFIFFGIVNMVVFTFLSPVLPSMGFKALGTASTEFETASYQRYTSIIADGDANTLGIFFTLVISLIIVSYHRSNRSAILLFIPVSLICVALTGSRTAFVSFVVCCFLFFLLVRNEQSAKLKAILLVLLTVGAVLAFPLFEMLISRLSLADEQLQVNTDTNRIGKWILYTQFFLRDPIAFVAGAQQELLIAWDGTYYAAHNVYLTMIYNAGLLFPLLFLRSFLRLFTFAFRNTINRGYVLLILPFFLLCMTVSDLGIFYTFFLFSCYYIVHHTARYGIVAQNQKNQYESNHDSTLSGRQI